MELCLCVSVCYCLLWVTIKEKTENQVWKVCGHNVNLNMQQKRKKLICCLKRKKYYSPLITYNRLRCQRVSYRESWRGADHVECEIHRRCVDSIHWREKEEVYLEIRKYSLWNTASNIKMKETSSRAQRRAIEVWELVWSQMKKFS